MPSPRFIAVVAGALAPLLAACAGTSGTAAQPQGQPVQIGQPPAGQGHAEQSQPERTLAEQGESPAPDTELPLNLPTPASAPEYTPAATGIPAPTFLEKGFDLLNEGEYKEAVNYFRRYQRLEGSTGADWEAEIAIAYVKMLPQSPYYNWRASRDSYQRLVREPPAGLEPHPQIVLMRDMLAILVGLHTEIDDLQRETDTLTETLEKREEALRRLRELTLGQ